MQPDISLDLFLQGQWYKGESQRSQTGQLLYDRRVGLRVHLPQPDISLKDLLIARLATQRLSAQ